MMTTTQTGELLFEEQVQLTAIQGFGFSWEEFIEGVKPIPPEGIRFDIAFEGTIYGQSINGTLSGVDHLLIRADQKLILDLHATIETSDGVNIAVKESGINDAGNLRLSMDFHTNDPRYRWLNHAHVWGVGFVDFNTGSVTIQGFKN